MNNMVKDFTNWGWKENPFVLKIDPKLFVGYDEQVNAVLNHIKNKHRIALITGRTGAGKSTFLKWLETNYDTSKLYLSKPPEKSEDFVRLFTDIFGFSIWERILRKKPSLYTLHEYINKKLKGDHLVFLVDEAHETNKEILEWLRVLTDQIDNVSLIMAGMPLLEDKIKKNLETLDQRIITRINLISLDKNETKELIKKRIEHVGGSGLKPFTEEAIEKIYDRTGGFPREVLKFCDRLVNSALERNLDVVDEKLIEEHKEIKLPKVRLEEPVVTFMPKPPTEEQFRNLPFKQKIILELLSKKDWLTPRAIVEDLELKNYKSKGHAIRSVNNILKRLMLDGYVQREARGKAFMYALTPKLKTLFVES
ncbi:MAG: AAA family ATPase [Candidatus Aenigmarchaeota archaeon]|nr:AAA family ATPase [Candidatus Aenigmarchaeota archaeon]